MKTVLASFIFMISMFSCNTGPDPIKIGVDQCFFCKMTISDARFGAEVITRKGKIYKFDDSRCALDFIKTNEVLPGELKDIYFSDYCEMHQLVNINDAVFLKSDKLRGPMGGNVAAFNQVDSLKKIQNHFSGIKISWNEINK